MRKLELVKGSSRFYKIPGYSRYGIAIDGEIINFSMNRALKGSKNPDGYINVRLTSDFGYVLTWGLHRLLMFVFNYPGDHYKDLVVNHKDGIKANNSLSNLEWVTYQENQLHAGLNGLTKKCLPIEVRNCKTGEILFFPSATACGQHFNFTKDAILWRLKFNEKRIFPEGNQYRIYNPLKSWYIPTEQEQALVEYNSENYKNSSKRVLMKKVLVDQVYAFDSVSKLANELNAPLSTISTWLSKKNQPVLPGYIQLKYATDLTDWRKVENPLKELRDFFGTRRIKVINEIDNSFKLYDSIKDCSVDLKINITTIHYRLKLKGSKSFNGLLFLYEDEIHGSYSL